MVSEKTNSADERRLELSLLHKLRLKVEIKVGKLEVELGDNGDSGQK